MMEKEQVVVGAPVRVGEIELIPVVRVATASWHGRKGDWFAGEKEPVAVIVRSPTETRAITAQGEEITLAELASRYPAVKKYLIRTRN